MRAQALDPERVLTPLHHKVYMMLRQQIMERTYPPETTLPSEATLCGIFDVSRITLRRALDRLESEGLIDRQQGKGTFVRSVPDVMPIRADLRGIFDNLVAMGFETSVRIIEFGYVGAGPLVARELGIAGGDTVQKAVRVRYHCDRPFSYLTTYLPEDIGRTFEREDMNEKPLLTLLDRAGVHVVSAEQTISAKLASSVVAALLDIEIGSALLAVRRIGRTAADRPVEYLEALYRPDVYEYQISMTRGSGHEAPVWAPSPRL